MIEKFEIRVMLDQCKSEMMKTVIIHEPNHKGSSYNIGRNLADKISSENEITEFFLPRYLTIFV